MEKNYLYASVPPNMHGTKLLSRNGLALIAPDLANLASRKYDGREHIRDMYIPSLECGWADLIFLTPYDPYKQLQYFMEAGFKPRPQRYFKIPLAHIHTSGLEIYWFDAGAKSGERIQQFCYRKFKTPSLPQAQIDEYRRAKTEDRIPLAYGYSPHIFLVARNLEDKKEASGLDISGCEIIEIDVMSNRMLTKP